jgi:hypothetical protein
MAHVHPWLSSAYAFTTQGRSRRRWTSYSRRNQAICAGSGRSIHSSFTNTGVLSPRRPRWTLHFAPW